MNRTKQYVRTDSINMIVRFSFIITPPQNHGGFILPLQFVCVCEYVCKNVCVYVCIQVIYLNFNGCIDFHTVFNE